MSAARQGSELFIVDNSEEDWKVLNYLREWCSISSRFDIATGYFEIGSLLALDGQWQGLDEIRILMGDDVKRSQEAQGSKNSAIFPTRTDPQVAIYSAKKTYGNLLKKLEKAFNKKEPLFTLPMYYPLGYLKDPKDIDPFASNRQKQVVALIRTLFLKRFESSHHQLAALSDPQARWRCRQARDL